MNLCDMGLTSYPCRESSAKWYIEGNRGTKWTQEENKIFEEALALFDKETPDRWLNVASMIPGKTVDDVVRQYRELVDDVSDIEAGLIPVPGYPNSCFTLEWIDGYGCEGIKQFGQNNSKRRSCADHERKKGIPWTEEEHRQFLLGLKKYGKGDWRNISRNFVTTRTPTQVASHAQKYFIRQLSGGKDKRRSSIHDITTVNVSECSVKSPSPERISTSENSSSMITMDRSQYNGTGLEQKNGGDSMGSFCSLNSRFLQPTRHLQQGLIVDPRGFKLERYDTVFQI